MKFIIVNIYLLFFVNLFCFSQGTLEIKSSADSTSIPFVTITYIKNDSIVGGTYTNEKGIASLDFKKNFDKINISHLSYYSKIIDIRSNVSSVIHLEEKIQELSEVIISNKTSKPTWIGAELSKKNAFISAYRGFEISTLITGNESLSDRKITKLKFEIKRRKELYAAILKIHFYDTSTNVPGRLINDTQDITVIIEAKTKGTITVDLEQYSIYLPKEGVFVGIEWLGLVDTDHHLIENDTYNDCSLGYNRVEKSNLTFSRNKFLNTTWNPFKISSFENDDLFVVPALSLEIE